jgi:uncharacterized Zn-finger protein
MEQTKKQPPCQEKSYEVTAADLPLCCPTPQMRLWDGHPRVYLPIGETGYEVCPYCGAEYILKDFQPNSNEEKTS